MRINPLVCVEVDEIATYDHWVSEKNNQILTSFDKEMTAPIVFVP